MKVTLAVLADAANQTDNGKLNILGLFQTIFTSSVPVQNPQMYLVLVLKASPGEKGSTARLKLVLIDADGAPVFATTDYPIPVPDTPLVYSPVLNLIFS